MRFPGRLFVEKEKEGVKDNPKLNLSHWTDDEVDVTEMVGGAALGGIVGVHFDFVNPRLSRHLGASLELREEVWNREISTYIRY